MIIDTVETSDLSDNPEEAFVLFEERLRKSLEMEQQQDRNLHTYGDGYYSGSFGPERYYVSSILAFLDERDLEIEVSDITTVPDEHFLREFNRFFTQINYVRTRFKLRKTTGQAGTPIVINPEFRDEIHDHLDTIRKIVNAHINDETKKDAIYRKIAALQSEVDRQRTTIDAVFGRAIDLSKVLREFGENLEPLVQKFERVMTALYQGADRVPLLTKKERPKLLPTPERRQVNDLDNDIPF
jgi:hypothetical protein